MPTIVTPPPPFTRTDIVFTWLIHYIGGNVRLSVCLSVPSSYRGSKASRGFIIPQSFQKGHFKGEYKSDIHNGH